MLLQLPQWVKACVRRPPAVQRHNCVRTQAAAALQPATELVNKVTEAPKHLLDAIVLVLPLQVLCEELLGHGAPHLHTLHVGDVP